LTSITISHTDKIVSYTAHKLLPNPYQEIKHHFSKSVGFIHIIPSIDYEGICRVLITPTEVHEYLQFRELLITAYEQETRPLPEQAIVGQFLTGDINAEPSITYCQYLSRLDGRYKDWDILNIIHKFGDKITDPVASNDYYKVIIEVAKLKRNDLIGFKKRFELSIEKAKKNELVLPYRIVVPRTGCGFVFIPLCQNAKTHKSIALKNLTLAHKYEQKLTKCVGISFVSDGGGFFCIDWCFMEFEWKYSQMIEEKLKNNFPFREVTSELLPTYYFNSNQI